MTLNTLYSLYDYKIYFLNRLRNMSYVRSYKIDVNCISE